jgi:hypothetical protein
MGPDNREDVRRPVHIPAKVSVGNGSPLCDCVVMDMSDTGAKIRVDPGDEVPDEFLVVFAPGGSPYRRCHVVWRTPAQLGVVFDKTITSHTCPEFVFRG